MVSMCHQKDRLILNIQYLLFSSLVSASYYFILN
jgi:hypothetical protein